MKRNKGRRKSMPSLVILIRSITIANGPATRLACFDQIRVVEPVDGAANSLESVNNLTLS